MDDLLNSKKFIRLGFRSMNPTSFYYRGHSKKFSNLLCFRHLSFTLSGTFTPSVHYKFLPLVQNGMLSPTPNIMSCFTSPANPYPINGPMKEFDTIGITFPKL